MIVNFNTAYPGSINSSTPKWLCVAMKPTRNKGGKGGNNGGHKKVVVKPKRKYKKRACKIKQVEIIRDEVVKYYDSAKECSILEKVDYSFLCKVLKGQRVSLTYNARYTGVETIKNTT